ncbi:MAG: hypothetical protein JWR24_71 [Actinoallomurus sp.]|nr:hypothetical protein [Actinoallomurus sp.]
MGIGTALAFIAIGAILAFAFHFHVSGIDVQMIGWILIFVGVAMLLITLMYTRPRQRRQVVGVVEGEPGAYASQVEEPPVVEQVVEQPVDPVGPEGQARPAPHQRRNAPRYGPE